jgi:hypothetical protein
MKLKLLNNHREWFKGKSFASGFMGHVSLFLSNATMYVHLQLVSQS